jgi:hypothetical protein
MPPDTALWSDKMKLPFPLKGIFKGRAASEQPQATSPDMNNMRLYDVIDNRARGGQRPGLNKWGDGDQIGGAANPIVWIGSVTTVD